MERWRPAGGPPALHLLIELDLLIELGFQNA
jgi:hypothetical protein